MMCDLVSPIIADLFQAKERFEIYHLVNFGTNMISKTLLKTEVYYLNFSRNDVKSAVGVCEPDKCWRPFGIRRSRNLSNSKYR